MGWGGVVWIGRRVRQVLDRFTPICEKSLWMTPEGFWSLSCLLHNQSHRSSNAPALAMPGSEVTAGMLLWLSSPCNHFSSFQLSLLWFLNNCLSCFACSVKDGGGGILRCTSHPERRWKSEREITDGFISRPPIQPLFCKPVLFHPESQRDKLRPIYEQLSPGTTARGSVFEN